MTCIVYLFHSDECWEDNNDSEDDIIVEAPDQPVQQETLPEGYNEAESLVKWLTIFFLRLQGRHYVPESAMNNLFKFISHFLKLSVSSRRLQVFKKSISKSYYATFSSTL